MFDYKRALILDIEGNSAKKVEELKITQFSALLLSNKEVEKEINLYNRSVNIISPFVQRLTHITLAQLKKEGMSERHLVHEIETLIKNSDVVMGWGLDFDKRIIKAMFDKYKIVVETINWLDIQKVYDEMYHPERLKLKYVARSLGFEEHGFHNSLIDCHAIKYILDRINEESPVKV